MGTNWMRALLLTSASVAMVATAAPTMAYAQEATYQIDIPAQSMGNALRALGKATKQNIVFNGSLVKGKRSAAVRGRMSASEALDRMLQGSGLKMSRGAGGGLVVAQEGNALTAADNTSSSENVGTATSAGCIDVAKSQSRVKVSGRLTLQLFPGPPNYESIAGGDAEESTFIIELPYATCIYDGGDFADPSERFVTVHVSGRDDVFLNVLRAAVGKKVTVEGEGFASHTGHHHAPLVVLADRITVE